MPRKVLIIDDEPEIAALIHDIVFDIPGYYTKIASNGLEALDAFGPYSIDPPDIVFTDFSMPELDGLGFAKKARESGYRGPIHMVSADTGPDYLSDKFRAAMARYGIDESKLPEYITGFVRKPDIMGPIQRILSGQAQEE